ncbi:hypothetical protein ABWK22_21145 [Gottfriedia acidiceleris]|uniref:hypothetical protein n=1 Tax=Gottfriedia acidiceleris TaxID=371036 RepID=UPI003393BB34
MNEMLNVEQKSYDELFLKYEELRNNHIRFQQETYDLLEYNRNILNEVALEIEQKQKLVEENLSLKQSIIQLNEKNQELKLAMKRSSIFLKILRKIKRILKLK